MTVDIRLNGYPDVHKFHFVQGSEAKAGRCVVDCAVGNPLFIRNSGPPRPKHADLTCITDSFQGSWRYMRVVKAIKARYGGMHVVLEDSRWILEKFRIDRNWNDRDASGRVKSGTRKSITELVAEIVAACDGLLTIVVDPANIPSFEPPARWAEKTCAEAMQDLLDNTGCRMVYSPENGQYTISLAGTGVLPAFPLKVYKPAPANEWNSLKFMSSPVVYEEKVDCTAVYLDNSTGVATPLGATDVLSLVKSATATDHAQEDYRLWKPDVTTPERTYLNHRPKSILNDPEKPQYEKGRVIRDDWEPFPVHQPLVSRGNEIVDAIELTNGGVVFVTDHPVLSADSSSDGYSLEAKVLTGYMKKDGANGYFRDTHIVTIDSRQSGQLNLFVDWIKPIESSEGDIPSPVWTNLFRDVRLALAHKYDPPQPETGIGGVQVITTDKFYHLGGVGQVAAVEYEFAIARRQVAKSHTMRIALNFTPGTESVIR